jgi:hypothetical protein
MRFWVGTARPDLGRRLRRFRRLGQGWSGRCAGIPPGDHLRQRRWQLDESRFAGPGARRAGLPASAPGDAGGAAGVWAETALGRPARASALRVTPPFAGLDWPGLSIEFNSR